MSSMKLGMGTSMTNTMLTAAAGMIQSAVERIPDFGFASVAIYRLYCLGLSFYFAWARYTNARTSATAV